MSAAEFDVIVIGSGQAGIPLALRLATPTRRVLLVERAAIGGTCINYGCTPTKTMIASARAAHVARSAGRLGVNVASVAVDLPAIVRRKDEIVRKKREGLAERLQKAAPHLVSKQGQARFVAPREIDVGGQRYRASTVIVNVGARPVVPTIAGLDQVPFFDNARIMQLEEVPKHLIVLGGGYIGCEFAQMFRRFGAEVTIVDRHPHILSREDVDTSSALEDVFRREGIQLVLSAQVRRVTASAEKSRPEVTVAIEGSAREVRGSHLLVAVGRRPNTDDLDGFAAGIELDEHGFVVTGDGYETSAAGVYAVGDVTGGPQFTHTSWDDHRLLYERLVGREAHGRAGRIIPYTVFTDPEVAGVGASESELRKQGIPFVAATMPFGEIARAIEFDETAGTMKIMIDPATERVLGCRLVGSSAGELIHVFAALMQAGASVRAVADMEAVHPTFSEGVQSLVMRLPGFALRP